jgi:hypothetical protein
MFALHHARACSQCTDSTETCRRVGGAPASDSRAAGLKPQLRDWLAI